MIQVTIFLKSARGAGRNRGLGAMVLANDGTGDKNFGNYTVALSRPRGRERVTEVERFPRSQKSVFHLIRIALNQLHERGELP